MARTTVETVKADNGKIQTVEKSYARGKGQEPPREVRTFTRPTLAHFPEYILSLSNEAKDDGAESDLAHAYRLYVSGIDREIASDVYMRAAGMSTIVRFGKKQFDLFELPLSKFIASYNKTVERRNELFDMAGVEVDDRDDDEDDMVDAINRKVSWTQFRNALTKHGDKITLKDGMAVAA